MEFLVPEKEAIKNMVRLESTHATPSLALRPLVYRPLVRKYITIQTYVLAVSIQCCCCCCGICQFNDLVQFTNLAATGFSAGGGLGMGVSPVADCLDKVDGP